MCEQKLQDLGPCPKCLETLGTKDVLQDAIDVERPQEAEPPVDCEHSLLELLVGLEYDGTTPEPGFPDLEGTCEDFLSTQTRH